jgi:hypothetical protein
MWMIFLKKIIYMALLETMFKKLDRPVGSVRPGSEKASGSIDSPVNNPIA